MSVPTLLDLFCGAGGCAMGYHRAGFRVVGVDIKPQKNYPFEFIHGDAMEVCRDIGGDFDVIHASPPCQHYSVSRTIHNSGDRHPDMVPETRDVLQSTGRQWVIENVLGAPLSRPVMLCGTHFGLKVLRHRFFESSCFLMAPGQSCRHPSQGNGCVATGRSAKDGQFMTIAGHFSSIAVARRCMGIDWMTRDELCQAIPPAYTEFIGKQFRRILMNAA